MPTIILQVYSGGCEVDCTHAVVVVDRQLARRVVQRIRSTRAQKEHDLNLVELIFWDGSPSFLRWSEALDAMLVRRVERDTHAAGVEGIARYPRSWTIVDDDAPEDNLIENVECIRMIVTDDSVMWSAILKHTSVRLETDALPLRLFEDVVAAGPIDGAGDALASPAA